MKAICTSACQIAGLGIVQAGEEIELSDGFYNDERIRAHFHIVESSVRDKNAKPPDLMADADARREKFAKSLVDHTAQIIALNKIMDSGAEIPREIIETDREDAPTESERIAKIVELWCDNFGYDFPTDEVRGAGAANQDGAENNGKPAKKGRGRKEKSDPTQGAHGHGNPTGVPGDGGEEDTEGETGDGGQQEAPDGKTDDGGDAGNAQQSLFDKLNGK